MVVTTVGNLVGLIEKEVPVNKRHFAVTDKQDRLYSNGLIRPIDENGAELVLQQRTGEKLTWAKLAEMGRMSQLQAEQLLFEGVSVQSISITEGRGMAFRLELTLDSPKGG